jgi:DNA-binding response OmpR family regulator
LGEYYFDKRNTELIIEQQRIELTSKEADLLLLLYNAANTTVERGVILNKVWGDEGDYIGRTLDVFISKLRKKLEFDSKVKIVNIRGIGYKLVMDV